MHEISLLENVREILENYALEQNFTKVTRLTLAIGKLSCIEPDALRFGFDVVMKDTLAEKAQLVIEEINGLGRCKQCGQQITLENFYDSCGYCGNPGVEIIQGTDMKIKDLIVL